MSFDTDFLYSLLPEIYRIRDEEQGCQLRALIEVIADQIAVLEEDLAQLYDNQFIETCTEWVIPYIGDLIGFRGVRIPEGLNMPKDVAISPRAQVANTISSRKKKGTFSNIARVIRDSTGWDCSVIEYFKLLAMTQNLNNLYLDNISIADIRQWKSLMDLNKPFFNPCISDSLPHNIDVRTISSCKGLYNIPNIGIFIWRLQTLHLVDSPSFKLDDHRYKFSPIGDDTQIFTLFDSPRISVPLSRVMLDSGLKGQSLKEDYPGISLNVNGSDVFPKGKIKGDNVEVTVEVMACDLSDTYDNQGKVKWAHTPVPYDKNSAQPILKIAVDPVLGRIAFPESLPESLTPKSVRTSFYYGFSADMGGGDYAREDSFADMGIDNKKIGVISSSKKEDIQNALAKLAVSGNRINIVEINNNEHYDLTSLTIDVSGENNGVKNIEIRAGESFRPLLALEEDMIIKGNQGVVSLNGLLISGGSIVAGTELSNLKIAHCTLVPGLNNWQDKSWKPSLIVTPDKSSFGILVEIYKSITGPIRMPPEGAKLIIQDSIVDSPFRGIGARVFLAQILSPSASIPSKVSHRSSIRVTIGRQGPYELPLDSDPKDIGEIRAQIESAIHEAHSGPGFIGARVKVIDNTLIIIPGVQEDIQVEVYGVNLKDGTRLDSSSAKRVHALCGSSLPGTLTISSSSPSMTISSEGKESRVVSFASSSKPDEIAANLQNSLSGSEYSGIKIGYFDEKFIVINLVEDIVPIFGPTASDKKTFEELGLRMDEPAISSVDGGPGPESNIERSTFLGQVKIKRLDNVSESIFADPLIVDQRQEGCLRLSFIPRGSKTPQRYECPQNEDIWTEGLRFVSTRYGDPGYCQLSMLCSSEIKQGDGMGELGAFYSLFQPQRETNMRMCLSEHMRFSLDYGVFYPT